MDSLWYKLTLIARSRPFLLCVLLVLVGFLYMHFFSSSHASMDIVIANVNVNTARRLKNQSIEGLYADELSTEDLPQNNKLVTKATQTLYRKLDSLKNLNCTKKRFDVSFLKVHKAGSTTLMNIFLRFAISHDLNVVLPYKSSGYGFNYLGYGETVSRSKIVPIPSNESYNILCNHVVYNKVAFQSIMPADTVYVGIIREPVSHFKSAALYYGFYNSLQKANAGVPQEKVVSEFLKNPERTKIQTYFVYNRMCFDFGIPKTKFHDTSFVEHYIEQLDRDYELVLILEYFPESLVLMKRILCWDTKDILYVPLNAMSRKPEFNMDDNDLKNLRKWNSADFKLYDRFSRTFEAKVKALGEDFKQEVDSFKTIQEEVKDFCKKAFNAKNTASVFTVPSTKWGESFTVTGNDCKLMMEPELSMLKRMIDGAWARYNQIMEEKKIEH